MGGTLTPPIIFTESSLIFLNCYFQNMVFNNENDGGGIKIPVLGYN